MAAASNDVLSWTNQDCRESQLFNSWGTLYRFQVGLELLCTLREFDSSFFTDNGQCKRAEPYYYVARFTAQQGRSRREAGMGS